MSEFPPTYLYIKQHLITKKLYFGKSTVSNIQALYEYKGSGSYWLKHISKHGPKHVKTLWYCLFTDKDECINFALAFSEFFDIVNSYKWANLTPENGIAGVPKGTKIGPPSDESRAKNSAAHKGRPAHNKGKKQSAETIARKSASLKGKNKGKRYGPQTPELIEKRVAPLRGRKRATLTCPHCGKTGGKEVMQRWHFDNCKIITGKAALETTCPHCGKTGSGGSMLRWHFDNCRSIK